MAATQGYKEVGVVLSAGVSRMLANRLAQQGMSDQQALFEGIKFGAISALLQSISLKTKSPVHGAYFNLFASSILKAAFANVEGEKDYGFNTMMISAPMTEGVADIMSLGRATPYLNNEGTFDLNWHNPNDVFFMGRYYDYIQDLSKYGFSGALMNQFISALHYQAVTNVRDILSGPNQRPYVLTSSRPAMSEMNRAYETLESAAKQVPGAEEVLKKDTKWTSVIDPFKEDPIGKMNEFIKTLTAKEQLSDAEKELVEAANNYFSLYQRDLAAWGAPGRRGVWKILEERHGRDEIRNKPILEQEAKERAITQILQEKTPEIQKIAQEAAEKAWKAMPETIPLSAPWLAKVIISQAVAGAVEKERMDSLRNEIAQSEVYEVNKYRNVIGRDQGYYQKLYQKEQNK